MRTSSKSLLCAGLTFMFAAYQARADVVAIVSVDSPTTTAITAEQISRIYLGESNMLTPLDIANPSSTRREFYAKVVGKDEGRVRAQWARLVFTGKVSAPRELPSGEELVKAVAADPKAIGYVDRSFVNMTVKIVYTVK
jgi:ABC-type phosphate transport system substrate-binding protein